MKKITLREMKWINKGKYKSLSYNKIEAKGNNSFLYGISNEDFIFSSSHKLTSQNYSLYISITDKTFIKLDINNNLILNISINGYESNTIINNENIINYNSLLIEIEREQNNIKLKINNIFISSVYLPAAMDAISFGFLFNNKEFVEISDVKYSKK